MKATTIANLHYLVVDCQNQSRIYVFMDADPGLASGGPLAEPVSVELLPGRRFGSPVDLGARPVLGQDPDIATRFREFRCENDLLRAKFVPIPQFRICDCWDDYFDPWNDRSVDYGSGSAETLT